MSRTSGEPATPPPVLALRVGTHVTTMLAASLVSDGTGVPLRSIQRWAKAKRIGSRTVRGVLHVDPVEVTLLSDTRGPGGRLPRRDRASGYTSLLHAIAAGAASATPRRQQST